ncbi:MAG: hypothetical protein AAFV07_21150, partial [Bacteroidota bacterium]
SIAESGFFVPGDAKGLTTYGNVVLATQNQGSLLGFSWKETTDFLPIPANIASYNIRYADGKVGKAEAYYGSGYLSQAARLYTLPQGATLGETQGW